MELRKLNERITNTFDQEGNVTTNVDSKEYNIIDADGNDVGSATVRNGHIQANINFSGFSGIAEGEAKLAAMFGIDAE